MLTHNGTGKSLESCLWDAPTVRAYAVSVTITQAWS